MTSANELHVGPLHQVLLAVRDLDAAVAFYRDTLGADLIATYDPPGMAFFDLGNGTRLYVSSAIEGEDDGTSPRENSVLYFRVDDIDAAVATLRDRGVTIEGEPHVIFTDTAGTFGAPNTEEWLAFFRDPEDNLLALAERRPQK
jgi:methylmalonyl-CoA/ethylmalonyl-CoA epimerase